MAWDKQVTLFATYFLANVNLPHKSFTLLDLGCGTGSALRLIKQKYPKAHLYGCDVADTNLQIAQEMNGNYATFFRGDFDGIKDIYDVIYISNVLEHISGWKSSLTKLIHHARHLYILVPYKELIKPLAADIPEMDQHISRFDKQSFEYLGKEGFVITYRVIRTPYAWGHSLKEEILLRMKAFLSKKRFETQRELLVSIRHKKCADVRPFKNRLSALFIYLKV